MTIITPVHIRIPTSIIMGRELIRIAAIVKNIALLTDAL